MWKSGNTHCIAVPTLPSRYHMWACCYRWRVIMKHVCLSVYRSCTAAWNTRGGVECLCAPVREAVAGQAGDQDGIEGLFSAWNGDSKRTSVSLELYCEDDRTGRLQFICNKQYTDIRRLKWAQINTAKDFWTYFRFINSVSLYYLNN